MLPVNPNTSAAHSASATVPIMAWWDPPADGATNMGFDEALAFEAMRLDRVLVRISTWSQPTLSLGAFQAIGEARARGDLTAIPIVRRPSGGGAILHGSDVTLAVAVPRDHPCGGTPQRLYDTVHAALVAELEGRGITAGLSAGGATGMPGAAGSNPPAGPPAEETFLCFDRRATGDVVVPVADGRRGTDTKILGSAQRRLQGAVLQHGSLLLQTNHLVPESLRHPGLDALPSKGGSPVGWGPRGIDLVRGWLKRLAEALGEGLEEPAGPFIPSPAAGVKEGVDRFRQDSWNGRR